ncbi:MAG: YveK family protein [Eubacteriales bacterium]
MQDSKSIGVSDLFRLFVRHLWLLALIGVIVTASVGAFNFVTYDPEYTSTSSVYIVGDPNNTHNSTDASRVSLAIALTVVDDCREILTSRSVLDTVIDKLGLDTTYKDLKEAISVKNVENTRIINVSVTAGSPELAKEIVDELCEYGGTKIVDYMDIAGCKVLDSGTLESSPSNSRGVFTALLLGVASVIIAFAVMCALEFSNQKIITPDDLKKHTSVPVLGNIPSSGRSRGKKHYEKYCYRTVPENSSAK